jgi:double-stranded uracil-DNA glycosylase
MSATPRDDNGRAVDAAACNARPGPGLAPVFRHDAQVLILGSFPGELSLSQQQYYAHPRNQFWPILGRLAGATPELPYPQRLERLIGARIALWDVLRDCRRAGSLDSRIRDAVVNDFAPLLQQLPSLRRVLLNGSTAASLFERHAGPQFLACGRDVPTARLPSTSPANAGTRFDAKLEAWRVAFAAAMHEGNETA